MTLGAALINGFKSILNAIASLTIPQAMAVGAFVGGAAYTIYLKIRAARKLMKSAHKPSTVTEQISHDFDNRRKNSKVDMDKLNRDIDDIKTRDIRETDRIYKDILDEIDETDQLRNSGRNHRYTKKNYDRDFYPLKKLKKKKKRKNGTTMQDILEDEFGKFYQGVDEIIQSEQEKKFDRYVGEEDSFSREANALFAKDFL